MSDNGDRAPSMGTALPYTIDALFGAAWAWAGDRRNHAMRAGFPRPYCLLTHRTSTHADSVARP